MLIHVCFHTQLHFLMDYGCLIKVSYSHKPPITKTVIILLISFVGVLFCFPIFKLPTSTGYFIIVTTSV